MQEIEAWEFWAKQDEIAQNAHSTVPMVLFANKIASAIAMAIEGSHIIIDPNR